MIQNLIQIGEPVEHRGIVVAPLFPRRDPVAAYVTLDEALAARPAHRRDERVGHRARARRREPARRARPPLRRRGARRREAEPHPQRQRPRRGEVRRCRSPSPASSRAAGAARPRALRAAPHISHAQLRRRKAEAQAAQPLARGVAQGEVWDEVREKAAAHVASTRRPARAATLYRAHERDLRALEDAFPAPAGSVRRGPRARRRPLPRRRLAAGRVRAPVAEAPCRLPARRARAARRQAAPRGERIARLRRRGRPTRSGRRQPSAGLGEDVRLRGERRDRLRARARRRAHPALGLHERGRRPARVRPDRASERAALTRTPRAHLVSGVSPLGASSSRRTKQHAALTTVHRPTASFPSFPRRSRARFDDARRP